MKMTSIGIWGVYPALRPSRVVFLYYICTRALYHYFEIIFADFILIIVKTMHSTASICKRLWSRCGSLEYSELDKALI